MQDLQQFLSNKGDELQRVAGAKESTDGNLKRMVSNLQQADTTIKVPSASSLHCHADLLNLLLMIVPSESALCCLPLFSQPDGVSLLYPSLDFMLQPYLSAALLDQVSVRALGWHLQYGCCDSKLPPNHSSYELKPAGQDCCVDTPV